MATSNLKIEGLDEFNKKIAELKDVKKIRSRANTSARKAMQLVQMVAMIGAARIDDPATREAIQENIVVRAGKSRSINEVRMRVGILGGAAVNGRSDRAKLSALPGGETVHWRFLEFGTSRIPATPFMRPALANNTSEVTDEFAKHFMKSIETAIAKGKIS